MPNLIRVSTALAVLSLASSVPAETFRVPADFRGEMPPLRANRDIPFACDLSTAEGLTFEFKAEDLSQFSHFTFYFWFKDGSYCGTSLYPTVENAWTRMTVRRKENGRGTYDWANVKGFRLSGWRGGTNDTFLGVRDIAVVPAGTTRPETDAERLAKAKETESANRLALDRLRTVPPKPGERRFVWAHNPNHGYRGCSWAVSAKFLAEHGFTDLIVNMANGPTCAYRSDVLEMSPRAEGHDRLEECRTECRRHGIRLHVWNVCWGAGWSTSAEQKARLEAEDRYQRNSAGKRSPKGWLCPSHPANRKLIVDSMLELADKGVDGVHFDYIRYPDNDYCFCDRCKGLFEKARGAPVGSLPGSLSYDPELALLWRQFRCAAITAPVRQVAEKLHESGSRCEVSAAVYRDPLSDPDLVGQDWASWCEKGYLDFVCPMTYEDDFGWFRRKLDKEAAQVPGRVPRYPGIGLGVWARDGLDVARFCDQVRYVRETGLKGFAVFELSWRLEQLMPKVDAALNGK